MVAQTPIWDRVLARLEREVEDVAAAVRDGQRPPTGTWTPPPDLGPVPEGLRHRTERLAARIQEVETLARTRADVLQAELDDLGRRRAAGAAYRETGLTP